MRIIISCLLVLLSTGCSALPISETQPIITSSPTLPSISATNAPTSTIELVTPSASPVLSSEETEAMILDLLQDNGNCFLPCWWGLTPGKTDARTTIAFLDRLISVTVAHVYNEYGSYERWLIPKNDLLLDISVSVAYGKETPNFINSLEVTTQVVRELDGGGFETVWENPLNEQYLRAYMLPQILEAYGQPEEVLIFANEGWRYFELMLDYSDQGFAIWYSAPLESSGDKFLGCPSKAFTKLYLWAPEFAYTWAEGVTGTGDKSEIDSLKRDFQPLEEATSMTLDEFYDVFVNAETASCLETPKELWPGP